MFGLYKMYIIYELGLAVGMWLYLLWFQSLMYLDRQFCTSEMGISMKSIYEEERKSINSDF